MIIERPAEIRRINDTKKWMLVYGRRKTGKTFLVENFAKWDEYFFVKSDRSIISKKSAGIISYETFLEILKRSLQDKKTVVVDEFHRLGKDFFDFLHFTKKDGKLILISSTLFLSKKLLGYHSALLGFFAEIPIGLISMEDCIKELKKNKFSKKELVELSVLLREPIAIGYFSEKTSARKLFVEIITGSIKTIPALVGEIFTEEERSTSAVYDGVLRAIADGKITSGEISSYLFSRKLIQKDDPSLIQQYLNNLVQFGIIKRIEIYGKKRFVYKHVSPLARMFYYADEKYNISETAPNEQELERIIDEIIPRLVEDNVRELFARKYGLREAVVEGKDFDIDACLLKFKKPEICLEVKWKKSFRKEDAEKAEESLSKIEARKKILFVPDKSEVSSKNLDIFDVSDF